MTFIRLSRFTATKACSLQHSECTSSPKCWEGWEAEVRSSSARVTVRWTGVPFGSDIA